MFERRHERLLSMRVYLRRQARFALLSVGLLGAALAFGTLGYHEFAELGWIDALFNATMILTGMGPVDPLRTDGARLFATGYALVSAITFVTTVGVLFAPMIHRFFHHLHLEHKEEDAQDSR